MRIRDKIFCKRTFNLLGVDVFSAGKKYTIMDMIELEDNNSQIFKGVYIVGDTKNYLYFLYSDNLYPK